MLLGPYTTDFTTLSPLARELTFSCLVYLRFSKQLPHKTLSLLSPPGTGRYELTQHSGWSNPSPDQMRLSHLSISVLPLGYQNAWIYSLGRPLSQSNSIVFFRHIESSFTERRLGLVELQPLPCYTRIPWNAWNCGI